MAEGKSNETLISFESGHYKTVRGTWKGDAQWTHFKKDAGGMVHINKEKVEYMETFGPGSSPADTDKHDNEIFPETDHNGNQG